MALNLGRYVIFSSGPEFMDTDPNPEPITPTRPTAPQPIETGEGGEPEITKMAFELYRIQHSEYVLSLQCTSEATTMKHGSFAQYFAL
jgi:hypothetical protein